MVLKQWEKIKLICGNNGDDYSNEMSIYEGNAGMTPFYSCPKFVSIYADKGGRSCNNRLNIVDFEKMLEYVTDEKYTDDGDVVSLVGMKWTKKGVDFKVIKEDDDYIYIVMTNKKAISK